MPGCSWEAALTHAPEQPQRSDLDALAALNYAGGTTGFPKGSEHTAAAHALHRGCGWRRGRCARRQLRVVVLLPVFWIAGENLGILFPLVRKRSETRMIGAADADCRGRRQEADGERRQAHEDAAGHQRRLAADPVADVAEHRAAQRAGGEPRLEGAEREQRAHQRREALGKNAGPNTRAAAVA